MISPRESEKLTASWFAALPPEVSWFAALAEARARGSSRPTIEAQRELRALGYSVVLMERRKAPGRDGS